MERESHTQSNVPARALAPPSERAAEIFIAAIEARPEHRDLLLSSWCGDNAALRREVDELMACHDAVAGPLDHSPVTAAQARSTTSTLGGLTGAASAAVGPGARIGQFIVESLIGEGGMGVVYLCRQDRPNRLVAVKLIRPWFATPAVLKRFEYEAEVLGRLQHPGIALIIESGTVISGTAIQPYFAMEYVKGTALDRSCRERQLGIRERVALVADVCDAVAHAYQRGVIHRDIKPDNILVDERGQTKVLDFGVARATGGSAGEQRDSVPVTIAQQLVGTLAYMSPEQATGTSTSVDTRTDVYGLGATLFEVLTDQLPIDLAHKSLTEAIHAIQQGNLRRIGDLDPRLRGDLETIVLKALALAPARRYQSVGDFAADLRHWLADEPISARPPSSLYQLQKFAKRRRGAVIGGATAVVALATGLIVATSAWRSASIDRDKAQVAATDRGQVAAFLGDMVRGIDPALAHGGDTSALRLMLDQTAARVDFRLTAQPDVQVELLGIVAQGYVQLGVFDRAETITERSLALHRLLDGDMSPRVASDIALIGRIRLLHGETDVAALRFNEALAMRRSLLGDGHSDVGASWRDLADISEVRGDFAKTEELLRRAIAIQRASDAPPSRDRLAQALSRLAPVVERFGLTGEAWDSLDEAIAITEAAHGRGDPLVADFLSARAVLALNAHNITCGERDYREALAIRTAALGTDHSLTAQSRQQIAQITVFRGETQEAERLERLATESTRHAFGPTNPAYATALGKLAELLVMIGQDAEAETAFNEALAILERAGSSDHMSARSLRIGLMDMWKDKGDFERSLPLVRQQLAEDEALTTIDERERSGVLISGTQIYALAAWNRVSRDPTSPTSAEALALGARAIELGHRSLAMTASFDGYRRCYPQVYAAAALLAHVLASWAESPTGFDREAAVCELVAAARLLSLGYTDAKTNTEVLPAPKTREHAVQIFESWTTRLYWLWSQVAPDEQVVAEFHRWRATKGGAIARLPNWVTNAASETDHGGLVGPP